jgi:hypothetical protein
MMHEDIRAGRELGRVIPRVRSDRYAQTGRIYPFGALASAVRTINERWRRAVKFPSERADSLCL